MSELAGKIVLVTGGGSGIGRAIAEAFAVEGCNVAIAGRTQATLQEAAESVSAAHPITTHVCDVGNRNAVDELFRSLAAGAGSPDVLINSAGINVSNRMMSNLDPADFDRVMNINVTGTFNCMHAALPSMREKKSGLIINVISVAGKRSMLLAGLPYCVSKHAQSALGTYVALEDAQHGIKVTNIYPGESNTPIVDKRPTPPPAEKRAAMLQPEDVAACAISVAKLPPRAVVPELVVSPPYMMLDGLEFQSDSGNRQAATARTVETVYRTIWGFFSQSPKVVDREQPNRIQVRPQPVSV